MLSLMIVQDGDVIAPELTPLKASWANHDGEDDDDEGDEGHSRGGNGCTSMNGQEKQEKARSRLF